MRAVLQRVKKASVSVDGETVSEIKQGLLVLLGVEDGDDEKHSEYLAGKITAMRIFSDESGKFNYSVKDIGGEMLVVSQFTLLANTKKGNRPSFTSAAHPLAANPLYENFCAKTENILGKKVGRGIFGADMLVSIENDGPVTIILDSAQGVHEGRHAERRLNE